MNTFELGPIRPPSEATSILLRVTRNCPWNKCTFCHTYKNERFSRRDKSEVMADIDSIHEIAQRILSEAQKPKHHGLITEGLLRDAKGLDTTPDYYYRQVAFWLHCGMQTLFLQDANSLILKTPELVEIIEYIKEKFPTINRITTYARAKTVSKKTLEELKDLRKAGLSRIHIGMESGSDRILNFIKKGVTAQEQIIAGQNAVKAGFDLSEYYMPGLGGREFMEENAKESARVLNSINPTFIRIRSTVPIPGTPLYQSMEESEWSPTSEEERVRELRLFLENLDGITSTFKSDHMMNLLEDVEGKLPQDKEKMIEIIDSFLAMQTDDKENFIIGRRLGHFRYLSDYRKSSEIDRIKEKIKDQFESIDKAVLEISRNYI
jgi:radical SAM superfamily enzyme YgiQ (UPF0313 family)